MVIKCHELWLWESAYRWGNWVTERLSHASSYSKWLIQPGQGGSRVFIWTIMQHRVSFICYNPPRHLIRQVFPSGKGESCDLKVHRSVARLPRVAQWAKNLPVTQEMQVWFLDQEDPLEEGMATHSSILAWRIPWTEEPGGLESMGSQRIWHDWIRKHVCRSVASLSSFLFHRGISCLQVILD